VCVCVCVCVCVSYIIVITYVYRSYILYYIYVSRYIFFIKPNQKINALIEVIFDAKLVDSVALDGIQIAARSGLPLDSNSWDVQQYEDKYTAV